VHRQVAREERRRPDRLDRLARRRLDRRHEAEEAGEVLGDRGVLDAARAHHAPELLDRDARYAAVGVADDEDLLAVVHVDRRRERAQRLGARPDVRARDPHRDGVATLHAEGVREEAREAGIHAGDDAEVPVRDERADLAARLLVLAVRLEDLVEQRHGGREPRRSAAVAQGGRARPATRRAIRQERSGRPSGSGRSGPAGVGG